VHILRWQDSFTGFKTNPATSILQQGAAVAKVSFNAGESLASASVVQALAQLMLWSKRNNW
jgi:hypothetical protein